MARFDKVNIGVEQRKKNTFRKFHSNSTTMDWGTCQTILNTYVELGDSNFEWKLNQFTRLAPLVAPTYGEVTKHDFYQFVSCEDVYPYYNEVLGAIPVNINGVSTVINHIPQCQNLDLSLLLLACSRSWCRLFTVSPTTGNATVVNKTDWNNNYQNYLNVAFGCSDYAGTYLFQHLRYLGGRGDSIYTSAERASLSPSNADYAVVFNDSQNRTHYLCFYLSQSGKLMKKHMETSRFKMNLALGSDYTVNLLPIFAIAKAYWDLFRLTTYDNYKDSILYKLNQHYTNHVPTTLPFRTATESNTELSLLMELIVFLGETFYSSDNDYISAHVPNTGLPAAQNAEWTQIRYAGTTAGVTENISGKFANSVGYDLQPKFNPNTSSNRFSQLDDELLKKMYYWVNRESAIGYQLRDLLVSRGYSQYVDECRSTFIGHESQEIRINSIVSMASTEQAELGEYGGNGQGFRAGRSFSFKAPSLGFIIGLSAIVPTHSYSNSFSTVNLGVDKFSIYNPEFDGFGMELSPKAIIGKLDQVVSRNDNQDSQSFGMIPRYMGNKVLSDIVGGDFNRPRYKNEYLPYILNRYITPSHLESELVSGDDDEFKVEHIQINDVPSAGREWRYPTRYKWLGNFDRVFRDFNEYNPTFRKNELLELENPDNFQTFMFFEFTEWSRMLASEDSFETQENEGHDRVITVDK